MVPIAALAALALAGAAAGAEFIPKAPATVKAASLRINTENEVKYRVHKCEAEGIADIRNLVSPFEEFWAFLPGFCTWIELGILEEIRGSIRRGRDGKCRPPSTISGIKTKDVAALIAASSELVLYHPHPTNAAITGHVLKFRPGGFSPACIAEASTETLEAALPGIPDLGSLFRFAAIFYRRHGSGHFAERILSVYGVSEYAMTGLGRDAMQSGQFASRVRRDMRRYLQIRASLGEADYKAGPSPQLNAKRIGALLEKLNHEQGLFRISFMPFE
jgi:hypothetical protein